MHSEKFNEKACAPTLKTGPDIVKSYHVHIYFEMGKASEKTAHEVTETIKSKFSDDIRGVSELGAVGPHTQPNFAVYVPAESFGKVVSWLQLNSKDLSILIHPRTGDDLRDHLEASMWLGKPVDYNAEFFTKLKAAQKTGGPKPH